MLSWFSICARKRRAERDVVQKNVTQVFQERKLVFDKILDQTLRVLEDALKQRGRTARHQANDNALFGPVSTAMFNAHIAGDTLLAVQLAKHALKVAANYEKTYGCEIHKGAIAFDLALMYLHVDDFAAAMRYFEIAEAETRTTESAADPTNTPSTFTLFRSTLFEENFWDRVDRHAKQFPVAGYKELWGVDFDKSAAKDDWDELSDNTKLLYLITVAQRMRYRQLANEASWDEAKSLHVAHWNLLADLGRVVETELKRKKQCPTGSAANTLGALLEQCFRHTAKPPNVSQLQIQLHQKHKVTDPPTFDAAFPDIRKETEQAATWNDQIANAVYLLRAVRNQVAHSVDDSTVLFKRPNDATFAVDVLLALCRVDSWTS